ncbi:hypothetical protein [Kitasatospora purpeofusca]|uniref:hypothetical protein n=1 Tax=Kitasatospora purpeofusca TaxID=67352 RepID=UPI0035E1CFA9
MTFWDQLPTLAGVVVGSVGSYAAASLTERSRWRRGRAERWDDRRFQIYASYGKLLKAQIRIAQRLGAARNFDGVVDPLGIDEGLADLARAESERAAEWESMLLVGDAATVEAARSWHEECWNLELYARGLRSDAAGWVRAEERLSHARDRFYLCARKDLGIAGPPPPSGNWPRAWQHAEPDGATGPGTSPP